MACTNQKQDRPRANDGGHKDNSSLQRHILISLSIRDIHKAGDSGFSKSQPAACWQSISASRAFPDAVGPPASVLADRSCAVEPDPPRSIPLWQDQPPPKKAPTINVVLKDGLPSVSSAHEVVDRPAIFRTDFARHLFIGPEFQDASMQGTDALRRLYGRMRPCQQRYQEKKHSN